MFHDRPFARVLLIVASALGLCVAQSAAAFPEETIDPGAPPSDFPDHSGELFNFGSTFIFSFSRQVPAGEGVFTPRASLNCSTCKYPVSETEGHTFSLTGFVLGQISGNDASQGVYDMNITIAGVRADVLTTAYTTGNTFFEQTINYTADLANAEIRGVITGSLTLQRGMQPTPSPENLPPLGQDTITVGAEFNVTPGLVIGQTFPAINPSSPGFLGQSVGANVVFQITETKRVPCHRDPERCGEGG